MKRFHAVMAALTLAGAMCYSVVAGGEPVLERTADLRLKRGQSVNLPFTPTRKDLVTLEPNDPCSYRCDLTAFATPGAKTLVLEHGRDQDERPDLVIRNIRVTGAALDERLTQEAAALGEEAERMEAARLRLYDDLPTLMDPPETQRMLRRFRLANWAFANSGDMAEFPTPEAAARRAREIKESPATAVIVRGRHFRLNFLRENERLLDYYVTAAKACHQEGLACLAHFDLTLFWQGGLPTLKENAQWLQRSLYDGTPTRWVCPNNPTFREYFARYVQEIVRRGVDGFMLDEISFPSRAHPHCGCEHCRRKFEEKTGFRLPEFNDPAVIRNVESPLWRLWSEWQTYSLAEVRHFLVQRMREVKPGIVLLTYSTNIYDATDGAADMLEQARACFVGTEGTDLTYAGYANLYAQHRVTLSFARWFGRPAWAQYPASNADERLFATLFFAPVTGAVPWGWGGAQDRETSRYYAWEHLEEAFAWSKPVASVGVLLSSSNRYGDADTATFHMAEAYGWMGGFGLSGIQFDPIPGKYAGKDVLASFPALIVPHAVSLPLATSDAVAGYVAEGGTAIVSGVAGRYGALGHPAGDKSLLRRMGLESTSPRHDLVFNRKTQQFSGTAEETITLSDDFLPKMSRQVRLACARFDAQLRPETRHEVRARFEDGAPAILSIPFGKGRFLYLAFLPGHAAFQPRMSKGTVVAPYHPPQVLALLRALAQEATRGADQVAVEGVDIISSAWRDGGRLSVRMVNVGGALRLPVGQPVGEAKPSYPALGPIRVHLCAPLGGTPRLFTPERAEPLQLAVVPQGDTRIIEIPAGAFRQFAFIRVEVAR